MAVSSLGRSDDRPCLYTHMFYGDITALSHVIAVWCKDSAALVRVDLNSPSMGVSFLPWTGRPDISCALLSFLSAIIKALGTSKHHLFNKLEGFGASACRHHLAGFCSHDFPCLRIELQCRVAFDLCRWMLVPFKCKASTTTTFMRRATTTANWLITYWLWSKQIHCHSVIPAYSSHFPLGALCCVHLPRCSMKNTQQVFTASVCVFQVCVSATGYRTSEILFAEKRHNLDILILRVVLSLRKNWDTLGPSYLKPTFKPVVTEVALLRGWRVDRDWGTSTSPALWLQATSLYSGANAWCKLQALVAMCYNVFKDAKDQVPYGCGVACKACCKVCCKI